MKVIIELPEDSYAEIKNRVESSPNALFAEWLIANSGVLTASDDTISRKQIIELVAHNKLALADRLRDCPQDDFYVGRYAECDRVLEELHTLPAVCSYIIESEDSTEI